MPRPVNRLRTACLRRFPLLLVSLVGCALLGTSPAWAHTELQSASPADGSSVPVAPTVVSLVFSDGLQPFGQVAVTGPDGGSVGVGEAVVAGSTVDQSVSIAEEGNYAIAYRVVSRDGHPVQGQISFTFLSAVSESSHSLA